MPVNKAIDIVLHMQPVSDGLPDSDLLVLVLAPESEEPIWPAFHDGESWRWANGMQCEFPITHWCDFPDVTNLAAGPHFKTAPPAAPPSNPAPAGSQQLPATMTNGGPAAPFSANHG